MLNKHKKQTFALIVVILVIAALACGTSDEVVQNTQPAQQPADVIEQADPTETPDPNRQVFEQALSVIETELAFNETEIDLDTDQLLYQPNPVGEGLLVYEPETRFYGVERYFIWVYIDDVLVAVNGATKGLTPNVPFPKDIDAELWARTRLDPFSATELIGYLFEGESFTAYETPEPFQTENEEIKFGYTIEERKEIYKDIIRAEDKAVAEDKPADTYYSEVMDKYGLSYDQVKEITIEGTLSLWPMPPEP